MRAVLAAAASIGLASATGTCTDKNGQNPGPCMPGHEQCGKPFDKDTSPVRACPPVSWSEYLPLGLAIAPSRSPSSGCNARAQAFHLMDQQGCAENDPNGPVFDPVHGVIHHFYQIHLAAPPGSGPDYGHFISKDFINWAPLPTAIWNGLDSSVTPFKVTKYDNEAIYTGSAQLFDGAGPGGKGKGIVNIYPGLCNKKDWPACSTGTLLAQAVPADYAGDQLLTNWTKPSCAHSAPQPLHFPICSVLRSVKRTAICYESSHFISLLLCRARADYLSCVRVRIHTECR